MSSSLHQARIYARFSLADQSTEIYLIKHVIYISASLYLHDMHSPIHMPSFLRLYYIILVSESKAITIKQIESSSPGKVPCGGTCPSEFFNFFLIYPIGQGMSARIFLNLF